MDNRSSRLSVVCMLFVALTVAGCGGGGSAPAVTNAAALAPAPASSSVSATPAATASATPTAKASATPTPKASAAPTATASAIPTPTAMPTTSATQCLVPGGASNVPVPSNCAYFGAWANPAGGPSDAASVNTYTTMLEAQIGQKLRLHMHYYGWGTRNATPGQAVPSFPGQAEIDDANAGRVPVVTWACGGTNSTVGTASSTVDVADYNLIVTTAQAVKAFGKPLFIRWNWEMNLTHGSKCMDSGTTAQEAAGFIAAWQNIYTIFQAQGVTNVSWLWNPGGAAADPDAAPFYPGNAYVDWIGFDGYDKIAAHDFGGVFKPFYQEYASAAKPILIAETGECPTLQQSYLNSAVAEIAGRPNSGGYSFPLVHGFMYFDSPGQYMPCTWNFDAQGMAGFATMGSDPYFAALP
jgi:hypothetical protein